MGKIFDRDVDNRLQVVDKHLQEMESANPLLSAIAENMRLDSRVSEPRSAKFAEFAAASLSATNLKNVLNEYSSQKAWEEFRCPVLNQRNLLFAPQVLDEPKIAEDTVLVSVQKLFLLLLSKLSEALRQREIGMASGDDIGSGPQTIQFDEDNSYVNNWLNNLELPQDLPEFANLITQAYQRVIDSMMPDRANGAQPERICWAGRRDEFEPHREFGLRRWMEIFGLGHQLDKREWFILLEYPVINTGAFARPTVLDAGPTEWHFPTPGELPPKLGGRTMILGDAMLAGVLPLGEFVHKARRLEIENVKWLSRLPDDTNSGRVNLDKARAHHRDWFREVKNSGALK
jgi:hypothetical protein